jgi:galactokinase
MKHNLISSIEKKYKSLFKEHPILVSSPGRINIIGEHTDYNDGFVLPAAINKGIITAIGKSDNSFCEIVAYDINEKHEFFTENTEPLPNGNWRNYILGIVGEIQKRGIIIPPFNLVFGGDIPNGAGLSSSAALENSVVFGLNALFKLGLQKEEMILISQKAEHNYVGVRCGIMDQYASMFGETNHALLLDCRTLKARPIKIDFKNFEIVLINTNVTHKLVDAEYNDRRNVCEKVASFINVKALRDATLQSLNAIKPKLTEEEYQKALYVIQENERVLKVVKTIEDDDLNELGKLLFEAHNGVQNQFKVSCAELDFLVEKAKQNPNVLGARMMGGGFGGCTINIVKKEFIKDYTKEISEAYFKEFNKVCSPYFVSLSQGTHVIKK